MDLSNENVIHIKKDGIEFLQFRRLLEYKDYINHAYSLGIDRNYRTMRADKQPLEKSEYAKAMEDYKALSKVIGSDYRYVVKPNQDHTDEVKIITEKIKEDEPDFNLEQYSKTDGMVTKNKNIILATTNADCILLLFFDPVKKVIGNTHSGWKGTLQRISVKTVQKMKNEFGCNPEDIICCICPSIRKCHFEVGKDVRDLFEKEFQDLNNLDEIIEEKVPNAKWNIDTVLINKIILERAGLKQENIVDSGICSVCNSELVHSFRFEKEKYGLCTALIELK